MESIISKEVWTLAEVIPRTGVMNTFRCDEFPEVSVDADRFSVQTNIS